eukprot:Platyproteum_vivax@DN5796_c0_g1_i1.p1
MDQISLIQQLQHIALQPPSKEIEGHLPVVTDTLIVLLDHNDLGVARLAASTIDLFCRNYKEILKNHVKLMVAIKRLSSSASDPGIKRKCQDALHKFEPPAEPLAGSKINLDDSTCSEKLLHSIMIEVMRDPTPESFKNFQNTIVLISGVISVTQASAHDGSWIVVNYRKTPSDINRKQIVAAAADEDFCGKVVLPSERKKKLMQEQVDIQTTSTSASTADEGYIDSHSECLVTSFRVLHPSASLFTQSNVLSHYALVAQQGYGDLAMQRRLGIEKERKQGATALDRIVKKLARLGDSIFG